jgi:hypothetical protein
MISSTLISQRTNKTFMAISNNRKFGFIVAIILVLILVPFIVKKKTAPAVEQEHNEEVLLQTIEIKVRARQEDLEVFEDGIVPWINLQEAEKEIDRLIDADKIILPYPVATLVIDYPLNKPAQFELKTNTEGWTKKALINEISQKYHDIYKEEEGSATQKTIPMEKREGISNRNQTNGKYGIWGHDLSDLDLSSIEVYRSGDKIILRLVVES